MNVFPLIRTCALTVFLLLLILQFPVRAMVLPGDDDYFVFEDGTYRFIYPEAYRQYIQDISRINRQIKQRYDQEYMWSLDEKPTLTLASPRHQIANGYATNHPRLRTFFYPTGAELIDHFAVNSWLYVLLAHETAHLHQLNVKHGYSQMLKKALGVASLSGLSFLPPFTYMQNPNEFLPTFMLEGNALFNEGRFGNGGRLYNGAIRAYVLAAISARDLSSERLLNDHLKFPYGNEKYWMGGYLNLYLAKKYGIDQTNRFFSNNAKNFVNPFLLNKAFLSTFGISYQEAILGLNSFLQPLAEKQKSSQDAALFTSVQYAGLSKQDEVIRVLTSDGIKPSILHSYDIRKKTWSEESVNMPMGRVFTNAAGDISSVGSAPISNTEITYGLFADGYSLDEATRNKIYFDKESSFEVYADATESFAQTVLKSKSGRVIARDAVSSAVLDKLGNSYYFKQEGKKRILFKNDQALFHYYGYYGFPVEIIGNGQIVFIGPSESGSGLFMWSDGKFVRLHASDKIVDARIMRGKKALIVELHSENYQYKETKLEPVVEAPFEYSYFYEKEKTKDFQLLSNLNLRESTNATLLGEKKYNAFSYWQFDGIDPFVWFGADTPATFSAAIRFTDPLQRHGLALLLSSGSYGEWSTGLQYINSRYVVNWDLLFMYQQRAEVDEDSAELPSDYKILDRYDVWLSAVGLNYPFYRRAQWESLLTSHLVYQYEDPDIPISDIDKSYTLTTRWLTSHQMQPPLAFAPYRSVYFELAHDNIRSADDWDTHSNRFGVQVGLSYDLIKETYLSATYQTAFTDGSTPVITIEDSPDDYPFPSATQISNFTAYDDVNFFAVSKASAQIEQAIPISFYFSSFPVSLRRFSLIAAYNEYFGAAAKTESQEKLFHEVGGGTQLELLLLHKLPVRLKVLTFESDYENKSNTVVILGSQAHF